MTASDTVVNTASDLDKCKRIIGDFRSNTEHNTVIDISHVSNESDLSNNIK